MSWILFSNTHRLQPQIPRLFLSAVLLALSWSALSQPNSETVERNIPYNGAFGPSEPPQTPLPAMQNPLDSWVRDALTVLYQRPSPQGPEPIPVEEPMGIYIEGEGPIVQVLPGPAVFPERIPEHLKTVMPEEIPFSNNVRGLEEGTFRAAAYDVTLNDTKLSRDEMAVEIEFTDYQGETWRIEQVTLASLSPNPVAEPWYGGVAIDVPYHGQTGNGSPAVPEVRCMMCSWGWADIYKNDRRVASSAPLHIMLTSDTRGDDFNYACYDCKEQPVREVHVVVPPSAYLPSPGGFLHIMWENAEWEAGDPDAIAEITPQLEEEIPTIELSAIPYLAWDQTEIHVEVGQKYRLLVHNTDPSSFHQFSLHSHPQSAEHEERAESGNQTPPMRHNEGGTAGGIGPLWQPGVLPGDESENPPGPQAVFMPLPQGSTWATFVQFDEEGEYHFMCPVGNHMRRGMRGRFIVGAAGTSPEREQ